MAHLGRGRRTAAVVALGVLAWGVTGAALPAQAQGTEITVTAEGEASLAPDMATLRLGVRERADTAEAALEAAAQATAGLLAALEAAGIDGRDVRTSELSLQPLWRSDEPRGEETLRGFEAASMVTARLRELDGLGALLSAAVGAGATRFEGLSFGLSNPDEAVDLARRRAVGDALRKGALYAEAAGVTLGPVRSIAEESAHFPGPTALRGASLDMAEGMPIATGEITVSARVTVVFGGPD